MPIYGSSRLGSYNGEGKQHQLASFKRIYEYANHLGNVLATTHDNGEINTLSDYFPFGLAMEDRSFQEPKYRYGFNGKENDTDLSSSQLIQDYGFRVYNPVIGRFLSIDPLTSTYPWLTPYQFASNNPIFAIDLDGLEAIKASDANYQKTKSVLEKHGADQVKRFNENYYLQTVERSKSGINGLWRASKNINKGEFSSVLGAVVEAIAAEELTSYFKEGLSIVPFANKPDSHDVETYINPDGADQYDVLLTVAPHSHTYTTEYMYTGADLNPTSLETERMRGLFFFGFVPQSRTYNLFFEVKLRKPENLKFTLDGFNDGIKQLQKSHKRHGESSYTKRGGIAATNRYLLLMDEVGFYKMLKKYGPKVKEGLEKLDAIGGGLILWRNLYSGSFDKTKKIVGDVYKATDKKSKD